MSSALLRLVVLTTMLLLAVSSVRAETVPVAKEPVETTDGGFTLRVSKEFNGRESKALKVLYAWAPNAADRSVTGRNDGSFWLLIFPDQPDPQSVATLRLRYEFNVNPGERQEIRENVERLLRALVSAVVTVAKRDRTLKGLSTELRGDFASSLKTLAKYKSDDGRDGAQIALATLGLVSKDGEFGLEDGEDRLLELDAESSKANALGTPEGKLICGSVSLAETAGLKEAEAALVTCRREYQDAWRTALKKYKEEHATAATALTTQLTVLEQDLTRLEAAADLDSFQNSLSEAAKSGRTLEEAAKAATLEAPNAPFVTPKSLSDVVSRVRALKGSRPKLYEHVELLTTRIIELQQEENGRILLERSAETRWWDVSTGVVYLDGLDDVVMPLMLAFCPIQGCLQLNETAFKSGSSFGRAWSVDLGLRSATLEKSTDPRHLDQLGLFVGASFNPIYFIRASAGMYAFENAQTNRWNQTWYVGATINILHTAQLLGVLGLGSTQLTTK